MSDGRERERGSNLDEKRGSKYCPTRSLDFDLEVAFIVGGPTDAKVYANGDGGGSRIGRPMSAEEARGRRFGYVLKNDSSARGVQKQEYVPLGPFTSKNFATTMSPWVVTTTALEPYRCAMVDWGRDDRLDNPVPLDYIRDADYGESREYHRQHLLVVWYGMRRYTFIGFVLLSSIEITHPPHPPTPFFYFVFLLLQK